MTTADFQGFLYVNTIPVTDAIKTNGAGLTKKYSKPCSNVPATANEISIPESGTDNPAPI